MMYDSADYYEGSQFVEKYRYSLEAEQAVIGALLIDSGRLDDVSVVIGAGDFYVAKNGLIFASMAYLVSVQQPVDVISVCEYLNGRGQLGEAGGMPYISDLAANSSGSGNAMAYARIVAERSLERRMYAAGDKIKTIANSEQLNLDEKILAVQSEIAPLEPNCEEVVLETNALIKLRIEALDRRFRGQATMGVLTGFKDLDERYRGWEPGDLVILAARPSMGKTTLALNICTSVAILKMVVIIFSVELPAAQIMDKLICALAGIPYKVFREGNLQEHHWPMLEVAARKLKGCDIKIIDISSIDIRHARNIAKKIARKGNLGLIMVDYLQLMTMKGFKERIDVTSEVSKGLKAMAKECNCPVLALSQLSRNCEQRANKRPNNSDLRESGQIEQDADIIAFIYRDEVYNENSTQKGVAEIITSKFRNGEIGTDGLATKFDQSKFEDLQHKFIPQQDEPIRKPYSRNGVSS